MKRFKFFRTTREMRTTWVIQDTETKKEMWLIRLGQSSGARNTCAVLNDPTHPRHESVMEMFSALESGKFEKEIVWESN